MNCSTLVEGGGVQVGVSVAEHFIHSKKFDAFFILSKAIANQLNLNIIKSDRIFIAKSSPANPLNFKIKNRIKNIENAFKPNLIYSVGFPSYIFFQQVELGRYTNPWALVDCSMALEQINFMQKIKVLLKARYRNFFAKHASYFETQTDIAAKGIEQRLKVSSAAIKVIPNSINDLYYNTKNDYQNDDGVINILYISAPHIHKNINIIPDVAQELNRLLPDNKFRFLITLPHNSPYLAKLNKNFEKKPVNISIHNLGKLSIKDCIKAYAEANIFFMPSLLEVFSASYLEAMQMSVPIVASDLNFAREICGDAAIYFDPLSARDAAFKIQSLINNKSLSARLVDNGKIRLQQFPTNKLKFEILDEFISKIIDET